MFKFLDPKQQAARAEAVRKEWQTERYPALVEAVRTQDAEAFQDEVRWLDNASFHVFPGDRKTSDQAMHDFLVGLDVQGVKVKTIDIGHPLDRLKETHVPQIVYCPMTEMQYEGYLAEDARRLAEWADETVEFD